MLMGDIYHWIGLRSQFENEIILDLSQMLLRCYWDAPGMLDKMPKSYICHSIGLKTQFENEIVLDLCQMLMRC